VFLEAWYKVLSSADETIGLLFREGSMLNRVYRLFIEPVFPSLTSIIFSEYGLLVKIRLEVSKLFTKSVFEEVRKASPNVLNEYLNRFLGKCSCLFAVYKYVMAKISHESSARYSGGESFVRRTFFNSLLNVVLSMLTIEKDSSVTKYQRNKTLNIGKNYNILRNGLLYKYKPRYFTSSADRVSSVLEDAASMSIEIYYAGFTKKGNKITSLDGIHEVESCIATLTMRFAPRAADSQSAINAVCAVISSESYADEDKPDHLVLEKVINKSLSRKMRSSDVLRIEEKILSTISEH